ncbi:MAG: TrmH family RNA methyltransferase [Bacteroidota bacterium]|nr:TrmH family RNA methyltransferase [Bacteroidota bacterium]
MKEIISDSNPWFKETKSLIENNRARKKSGKFVVEGIKEIQMAFDAGFELMDLAWCDDQCSEIEFHSQFDTIKVKDVNLILLSPKLFGELVVRASGRNALGVFRMKPLSDNQPPLKNKMLILVAEGVEKPGNLGAILRTCDAAGVDGLILAESKIDVMHPQVIRNSLGSVFHVPIWIADNQSSFAFLTENDITIYTTFMQHSTNLYDTQLADKTAFVVGTEHEGVSPFWVGKGKNINIPMNGVMDSLNVSVASALLVYEGLRQIKEN